MKNGTLDCRIRVRHAVIRPAGDGIVSRVLARFHSCLSRFSPLRSFLAVLLLFAANASPVLAAGPSPEFFQLMNELKEDIRQQGVDAEGPICIGQGLVLTRDVIEDGLRDFLLNVVVVQPLEDGAKTALSLLPQSVLAKGAATVTASTYDLIRCAMDSNGPRTYAGCIGKVTGAVVEGEATGRIKEKLGLEDAATSQAFDRSYNAAKTAIGSYKARSEIWNYSDTEDDCKSDITVRWNKQDSGKSRGGTINVIVNHQCKCPNEYDLESGHYQIFNIPVYYTPASGNKPGWRLGSIPRTRTNVKCCGGPQGRWLALSPTGKKVPDISVGRSPGTDAGSDDDRPVTGAGDKSAGTDEGTGTASPPPPPPVVLPAPELKEYDRANPCPPCQPIKDQIDAVGREIRDLRSQRDDKLREQNARKGERRKLERRLSYLQSRLRGEAGIGAESYDPATGRTTSSYDTGDGRVRIRVTDAEGNVISERFRERESTQDIQNEITARQQALDEVNAAIERLGKEREQLQERIDEAGQRWDNLQKALTDCVDKLCREYATCKQLIEHIRSYESAGLQQRSSDIINELYRRAREKGCFDIDATMLERVGFGYDLTGNNVYKPSILDELTPAGIALQQQQSESGEITPLPEDEQVGPQLQKDGGSSGETVMPLPEDERVVDDLQPMGPPGIAKTRCQPCKFIADEINQITAELKRYEEQLEQQREEAEKIRTLKWEAYDRMTRAQKELERREVLSSNRVEELERRWRNANQEYRKHHEDWGVRWLQIQKTREIIEKLRDKLIPLKDRLYDCEKQCVSVEVIDVKHITGNNPFDRRDPIAEDARDTGQGVNALPGSTDTGGSSGSGPTVEVINNIPISRLTLIGPEAGCPADHYHGAANNCNGVFTTDPDPTGCGHGTVAQVQAIPASSCPDL